MILYGESQPRGRPRKCMFYTQIRVLVKEMAPEHSFTYYFINIVKTVLAHP